MNWFGYFLFSCIGFTFLILILARYLPDSKIQKLCKKIAIFILSHALWKSMDKKDVEKCFE